MAFDFLTIGEVIVDFSQTTLGPHGYPQYEALPGGAPANVAAALAKWGRTSGLIGKVGNDALGKSLAATLKKSGVDCSQLLSSNEPTSLALVSLAGNGEREFAFYWNQTASATLQSLVDHKKVESHSKIFHFGSVTLSTTQSREATFAAVKRAKSAGATISFDLNLRPGLWGWKPEEARVPINEAIALSDIVKLSEEELYFLFSAPGNPKQMERDSAETIKLVSRFQEHYDSELLYVTFGAQGTRWKGRNGSGWLDSPKVNAVDTTGAGDCFFAGVLHEYLTIGRSISQLSNDDYFAMANTGVFAGALSTLEKGGITSIPTSEKLVQSKLAGILQENLYRKRVP